MLNELRTLIQGIRVGRPSSLCSQIIWRSVVLEFSHLYTSSFMNLYKVDFFLLFPLPLSLAFPRHLISLYVNSVSYLTGIGLGWSLTAKSTPCPRTQCRESIMLHRVVFKVLKLLARIEMLPMLPLWQYAVLGSGVLVELALIRIFVGYCLFRNLYPDYMRYYLLFGDLYFQRTLAISWVALGVFLHSTSPGALLLTWFWMKGSFASYQRAARGHFVSTKLLSTMSFFHSWEKFCNVQS